MDSVPGRMALAVMIIRSESHPNPSLRRKPFANMVFATLLFRPQQDLLMLRRDAAMAECHVSGRNNSLQLSLLVV